MNDQQIAEYARNIRRLVLKMVHAAKSGHPGGPLGLADIYATLFCDSEIYRFNAKKPDWDSRDRLLLSNGHVCAVRYAAMSLAGFFSEKEVLTFRKVGSKFQGHPSTRYIPAMENSSGSLGQGLSAATGIALGKRLQGKNYNVFVCISDGECGEGMTWEAATAAAHHKAPIIAFMDYNGIQIDGFTKDVCNLGDLEKKFESFGWRATTADGHNIPEIRKSLRDAVSRLTLNPDMGPQIILFRTVLGKGVSFMENAPKWHGTPPNDEQFADAMKQLGVAV
ncbi:MAG: transketolase [Spirochaetia bacterium]|nr:transketolase [Spirochaetia bacterium]